MHGISFSICADFVAFSTHAALVIPGNDKHKQEMLASV